MYCMMAYIKSYHMHHMTNAGMKMLTHCTLRKKGHALKNLLSFCLPSSMAGVLADPGEENIWCFLEPIYQPTYYKQYHRCAAF